jgi:hypothetical protein
MSPAFGLQFSFDAHERVCIQRELDALQRTQRRRTVRKRDNVHKGSVIFHSSTSSPKKSPDKRGLSEGGNAYD